MALRCYNIPPIAVIIPFLLFACPPGAAAATRVSGNYFLEETNASGPQGSTDLVVGGINFNIEPKTAKRLYLRFSVPLTFEISHGERNTKAAPIGKFGADLGGEWFTLSFQYGRYATISSSAQLIESTSSRAAFSLAVPDLPRLSVNYSKTDTTTGSVSSQVDGYSVFSDYRFKAVNFRAGHFSSTTVTGDSAPYRYSSLLLGMGGNYEVLPMTVFTFDDDYNRYTMGRSGDGETTSTTNTLRMSAGSRPFEWFSLGGNFFRTVSRYAEAGSTDQQSKELSASVNPSHNLTLSTTTGIRSFTDGGIRRNVDYRTVGAAFSDRIIETVLLGLTASRFYNSDPTQGKEITDNYGVNAVMDVRPGVSATAMIGVSKSENREFVSVKQYDAYGTLAQRANYDDRPPGFTFFDVVNNDLYTKNSAAIGDWSLPVHIDPVTKHYGINKNLQVNMVPTDKTSLSLAYSSSFSSDKPDLSGTGSRSWRGFLTWMPNRRVSYSIYRTLSVSENGSRANATSATMSYHFFRGHQLNMIYSRQESGGRIVDAFSGILGLTIGRRTSMQIVYAVSQWGREDETTFFKAGITQSF